MSDYSDSKDKGRSQPHFPLRDGSAQNQRRAGNPFTQTCSGMLPPQKTAPPAVVMRKADGSVAAPLPFTGIPDDLAAWAFHPHIPAVAPPAPVQARGDVGGSSVHEAAAEGIRGSGASLPHAERIQAAFGPAHDISHVQAHVGGGAALASEAIGAEAYATGHHIAFREAPDLHTAAHEAAHVIQQQQGVMLKGGVGQAGDVYERHADAVADRVVAGQSAADLLAVGPNGGGQSAEGGDPATKVAPAKSAASTASSQTQLRPADGSQDVESATAVAEAHGEEVEESSGEGIDEDGKGGSSSWSAAEVSAIIAKTDPQVIERINKEPINIIRFKAAFDTWRYNDGRVEEVEVKGLRGNTRKADRAIRLAAWLTPADAATTLFHEMAHMARPQAKTRDESLEEEIDVRVETEEFAIRQGMPPTVSGYRANDGKPDRAFIKEQILKSKHYNPKNRTRIKRRYEGEERVLGWTVPAKK